MNGLKKAKLKEWPKEEKLIGQPARQRKPLAPADLGIQWDDVNRQLATLGIQPVSKEELIAGRCYTGPLFIKYNGVLRSFTGVPFLRNKFEELCKGNK